MCLVSNFDMLSAIFCIVQAAIGTLDGVLDTVSVSHPISPLIDLLGTNRKLILLGKATGAIRHAITLG